MKYIISGIIALIVVASGAYYFITTTPSTDLDYQKLPTETPAPSSTTPEAPEVPTTESSPTEAPRTSEETAQSPTTILGSSVGGRSITAYHFGNGERELLLIGGIHGGYSWNTALLAYELIEWLQDDPTLVPSDVRVTIIPALNPDGLNAIVGTSERFTKAMVKGSESDRIAARFNTNGVDLNRNFDCEWQTSGTWQSRSVSGGDAPFSEPEAQALAAYVADHEPTMVIAWYSAAGGVYASACGGAPLPATLTLTKSFATAAGYTAHETFDYYEITGDMVNWFAKQEIPAISVLLSTHDSTEFSKNQTGVQAIINVLSESTND